jgi:signal transduction histidine kinase
VASTSEHLLNHLVGDILDLSKFESGGLPFVEEQFDLRRMLHSTVELGKAMIAATNITLSYQLGPGVPEFVVGDTQRLGQVLLNLVGNAIKFTQVGAIQVRVRVASDPEWYGVHACGEGAMATATAAGRGCLLQQQQ